MTTRVSSPILPLGAAAESRLRGCAGHMSPKGGANAPVMTAGPSNTYEGDARPLSRDGEALGVHGHPVLTMRAAPLAASPLLSRRSANRARNGLCVVGPYRVFFAGSLAASTKLCVVPSQRPTFRGQGLPVVGGPGPHCEMR